MSDNETVVAKFFTFLLIWTLLSLKTIFTWTLGIQVFSRIKQWMSVKPKEVIRQFFERW
jgi:hypothetical protein